MGRRVFSAKIVDSKDVTVAAIGHVLPSGTSTDYGFGWMTASLDGVRRIAHGGGTLGFHAMNDYSPDLHAAIIVLVNEEPPNDVGVLDRPIFEALRPDIAAAAQASPTGEDQRVTALALHVIHEFQTGTIDPSEYTARQEARATPERVKEAKDALGERGEATSHVPGKNDYRRHDHVHVPRSIHEHHRRTNDAPYRRAPDSFHTSGKWKFTTIRT